MSKYTVIIKEEAQADLRKLLSYEPKAYNKALRFIGELYDHPKTGLGHPEPLKAYAKYLGFCLCFMQIISPPHKHFSCPK